MSTLTALVTDLRDYTEETATTLPTALLEGILNRARQRMMRKHGFQGQQTTLDFTYTGGAASSAVPADFVAEYGLWRRTVNVADPSATLAPIPRLLRRQWIEARGGLVQPRDTIFPQTADPASTLPTQSYYIWKRAISIVPTPTAALTLTLDYFAKLVDLTGATSDALTDTYPDVLLALGLAEVYGYLHEYDAMGVWAQTGTERLGQAIVDDERLAASGPVKTRGTTV